MLIVVIIIHYSKDILRGVPPQPNQIGKTELSEIQINTLNKLSQVEYTIDPNILELFNDLWNDPVRSGISSPLVIITLFSSSFLLYGPGGPGHRRRSILIPGMVPLPRWGDDRKIIYCPAGHWYNISPTCKIFPKRPIFG